MPGVRVGKALKCSFGKRLQWVGGGAKSSMRSFLGYFNPYVMCWKIFRPITKQKRKAIWQPNKTALNMWLILVLMAGWGGECLPTRLRIKSWCQRDRLSGGCHAL